MIIYIIIEKHCRVSSDFYKLFSEHLSTHCMLELWGKAIYKVNQDFNGDSEKEITACGNFGLWTIFVLNNLTSAYF